MGYLAYPRLSSALFQTQPRCACVRNDIATNGLLGIWVEHGRGSAVHLCDHLVCDDNRNAKLVCQALQCTHEFGEVSLPRRQLTTTHKVGSVQRRGAVNDKERESRLSHHLCCLIEQRELMVRIVCPRICHVVENVLAR